MPNRRYNTVKEREYKIWVCAGKEFNSLEAARRWARSSGEVWREMVNVLVPAEWALDARREGADPNILDRPGRDREPLKSSVRTI